MKKEEPLSKIGCWVDAQAYDQLQQAGEEFIQSCMRNRFVLTEQEQQTLFLIIRRIEEYNWDFGTYPADGDDLATKPTNVRLRTTADPSDRLRALLRSVKESK